jgi:hypothetical protein
MKILFFSADAAEVEAAREDLADVGIACEVHTSPVLEGVQENPDSQELWIQDDTDSHRALMRCVWLGVGFSRRPPKAFSADEIDDDFPFAEAA